MVTATVTTLLGPLSLLVGYLSLSGPNRSSDQMAIALAILTGVVALWWLPSPSRWWEKAAITVFYVPVMGVLLLIVEAQLVCGMFGQCL